MEKDFSSDSFEENNVESLNNVNCVSYIENFDLSFLPLTETENLKVTSNTAVNSVTKLERILCRLRKIEECLGIFYIAFWKVKIDIAVETIVTVCRERFNWEVSEKDFTIAQPLKCRRAGVLLRVSSIFLRDQILNNSHLFLREGFYVANE